MERARSSLDTAEEGILLEALEDHIGLWEFTAFVRRSLSTDNEVAIRSTVLALATELLERGVMVTGFPTTEGDFEPEDSELGETVERIEREWRELGRMPDVGEIIWFDLTESGEHYARNVARSRRETLNS